MQFRKLFWFSSHLGFQYLKGMSKVKLCWINDFLPHPFKVLGLHIWNFFSSVWFSFLLIVIHYLWMVRPDADDFRILVSIRFEDWWLNFTSVGLTLLILSLRNIDLLKNFLVLSLEKNMFIFSLTSDFEHQVETTEIYSKTDSKEKITVSAIVSKVNNFPVL